MPNSYHPLEQNFCYSTMDGSVNRRDLPYDDWEDHPIEMDTSSDQNRDYSTKGLGDRVPTFVRFSPYVSVYFNTDEEDTIPECWYTKEEIKEFKSERKKVVRILKMVNFDLSLIDTTYSLRGLEPYSSVAFNSFMQKKRKGAFMSVLQEQHRQRSLGINDVECLRTVSAIATEWARDRAVQLGSDDAIEVGNKPHRQVESYYNFDDNDGASVPSVMALSYDSMSLASDDSTWADKLLREDLIPDS